MEKTENKGIVFASRTMLIAILLLGVVGGVFAGVMFGTGDTGIPLKIAKKLLVAFLFPGMPMSIFSLIVVALRKDKPFIITGIITLLLQILCLGAIVYLILFMPWPT
ncbi:MAG: hypothetical protein IKT14_00615 [Clostridiales bacterium]|nr:hypothetical protein [Clostridiales bacterium]